MNLRTRVCCLILAGGIANAVYGGLIAADPNNTTDLTSFGFGVIPPVLTLQADTLEQGCVVPVEDVTCDTVASWDTFNPITGDVSGEKKYSSPTLLDLGITSWADLAILFNVNEPNNVEQVTLQDLRLGLFDTNGTFIQEFILLNPTDFTNISQGQGSAGFVITIDAAQQAFPFDSTWSIGMAAQIGCLASVGGCDGTGNYGTGDGPESFTVVSLGNPPPPLGDDPIPEPASLLLIGSGLGVLGLLRYRRRKAD